MMRLSFFGVLIRRLNLGVCVCVCVCVRMCICVIATSHHDEAVVFWGVDTQAELRCVSVCVSFLYVLAHKHRKNRHTYARTYTHTYTHTILYRRTYNIAYICTYIYTYYTYTER
jgi:hypothetical protein